MTKRKNRFPAKLRSIVLLPGHRRDLGPNDIAGSLYKVSAYPDAAAYVSKYPDYSSAVYEITGTEMKKIKTYFNKTSIIDNIEIQTGGLTLQDVVDKYGKELNADAMEDSQRPENIGT